MQHAVRSTRGVVPTDADVVALSAPVLKVREKSPGAVGPTAQLMVAPSATLLDGDLARVRHLLREGADAVCEVQVILCPT